MESFFTRYKNALVLLLVLVLQLLVLAVQAKRPSRDAADPQAVSLIRYTVVTAIATPERLLRDFGQWIEDVWFGYIDLIHVRRDNAALKGEIERLRLEQATVVEDARQGQRLQQLLGFKEHYIYQTVPAQVIGTAGTDQSGIVYIDKGSKDGLKPDMPVVTQDGIVGRLRDVFPNTSQLMLISDATSGVGVILEATRTRGILKGGAFGQVQVVNVSPDDRIKSGEKIITSGGDQIFPRGLPVGTVDRAVTDPDRDPLMDVVIHPAANLSQLEEVLVITGMGDVASSQEAKDLAESEAEGEAEQKRASDVLSERLPSRVDPNAPADTNPDENVDSTGNVVRPLQPPKALHADGFTPGATPPATELTPGERTVPVKNGVEVFPPKTKPASNSTASSIAAPAAEASTGAATGGTDTPRKPAEADANGAVKPSTLSRPAVDGAAGSSPKAPRPSGSTTAAPASAASGEHPAPLKPDLKTHVVVDGPEPSRPPKLGNGINASPGTPARRPPTLVPDDGSRPPAETKPKKPSTTAPPPATTTPQPATPQGRGA